MMTRATNDGRMGSGVAGDDAGGDVLPRRRLADADGEGASAAAASDQALRDRGADRPAARDAGVDGDQMPGSSAAARAGDDDDWG